MLLPTDTGPLALHSSSLRSPSAVIRRLHRTARCPRSCTDPSALRRPRYPGCRQRRRARGPVKLFALPLNIITDRPARVSRARDDASRTVGRKFPRSMPPLPRTSMPQYASSHALQPRRSCTQESRHTVGFQDRLANPAGSPEPTGCPIGRSRPGGGYVPPSMPPPARSSPQMLAQHSRRGDKAVRVTTDLSSELRQSPARLSGTLWPRPRRSHGYTGPHGVAARTSVGCEPIWVLGRSCASAQPALSAARSRAPCALRDSRRDPYDGI